MRAARLGWIASIAMMTVLVIQPSVMVATTPSLMPPTGETICADGADEYSVFIGKAKAGAVTVNAMTEAAMSRFIDLILLALIGGAKSRRRLCKR